MFTHAHVPPTARVRAGAHSRQNRWNIGCRRQGISGSARGLKQGAAPKQARRLQATGQEQRLKFRSGDNALGQLGMLQGVATTVRDLNIYPCTSLSIFVALLECW